MKCNVDIHVNSHITVMLPGGTAMFHEIGERMTMKPTELPLSTTKIKVVAPPERELGADWRVSPDFFYRYWISRASTMDLARPSSTGSAFEHTMFTSRISEQQCSVDFEVSQGSEVVSLRVCLLPPRLYFVIIFLAVPFPFTALITLFHCAQKKNRDWETK